jgi:hypothetical protein
MVACACVLLEIHIPQRTNAGFVRNGTERQRRNKAAVRCPSDETDTDDSLVGVIVVTGIPVLREATSYNLIKSPYDCDTAWVLFIVSYRHLQLVNFRVPYHLLVLYSTHSINAIDRFAVS